MPQTSLDCLYNLLYHSIWKSHSFVQLHPCLWNKYHKADREKEIHESWNNGNTIKIVLIYSKFYAKVTIKKKEYRCWIVKKDGFSPRYVLLYNCCVRLPFSHLAFHARFLCVRILLILHSFGLTDPLRSR